MTIITTKKRVRKSIEPLPKAPPPMEDGFAQVAHTDIHFFKRRGKKYTSMCGLEFMPPHLGNNTRLFSSAAVFKEYLWCDHCRKSWENTVQKAINVINRHDNIKITC